jgi:phosphatidylinositol dimannoside acyltransferase
MAEKPRSLADTVTVGGYKLGSLIARATPGFVAQGTVSLLAPGIALSLRSKRAVIERNLQRVDPTLKGLALRRASQRAFDSYMRYYTESFRLPSLSKEHVNRCFTADGYEYVEQALEKGNGVIFAIPHLGGWEWAGRWMAERGLPMTVIVEPLQPPELFEWFTKLRSELGMNVVPLGPDAAPTILTTLKQNGIVCLLSDRDIQRTGVEVDFFGEKTTLPAGPAMLGIRGNTPVLPVAIYFTDSVDGHHAIVHPPVKLEKVGSLRDSVAVGTQAIARELETLIRRAPEQWHMFQPNWPSDPGY